jgi:hypothetical protein
MIQEYLELSKLCENKSSNCLFTKTNHPRLIYKNISAVYHYYQGPGVA